MEKEPVKMKLSTLLLAIALIVIIIMGFVILYLQNEINVLNRTALRENNSNLTNNNQVQLIGTLKPSRKVSKLIKDEDELDAYIFDDEGNENVGVDEFYMDEICIGDQIYNPLVEKISASSTYESDTFDYNVNNISQCFIDNCWCEGVLGDGIGETINIEVFGSSEKVEWPNDSNTNRSMNNLDDVIDYLLTDFNEDSGRVDTTLKITEENIDDYYTDIKQIAIVNGFAKSDELWKNNGRIKKLKLTIDNKLEYILELDDCKDIQLFDLNYKSDSIKQKINMEFEILEVYPGEKYDDTCLTAIHLVGNTNIPWGGR